MVYFLSHMHTGAAVQPRRARSGTSPAHADHLRGLTPTWSYGHIYCSEVTKLLLLDKFGISESLVVRNSADWASSKRSPPLPRSGSSPWTSRASWSCRTRPKPYAPPPSMRIIARVPSCSSSRAPLAASCTPATFGATQRLPAAAAAHLQRAPHSSHRTRRAHQSAPLHAPTSVAVRSRARLSGPRSPPARAALPRRHVRALQRPLPAARRGRALSPPLPPPPPGPRRVAGRGHAGQGGADACAGARAAVAGGRHPTTVAVPAAGATHTRACARIWASLPPP